MAEDMGFNKISSFMQKGNSVTGKVVQALSLSGTSSVFQAYAFNQLSRQVCSSPEIISSKKKSSDQRLSNSSFIRNSHVYIDDLYFGDFIF
jgi:hypothetical protein